MFSGLCPVCNQQIEFRFSDNEHLNACIFPHSISQIKAKLDSHRTEEAIKMLLPSNKLYLEDKYIGGYHILMRRFYITKYHSWHLTPTYEQLLKIKNFIDEDTCLEIGAGFGMFAALLKSMGCSVIATDAKTDQDKEGIKLLFPFILNGVDDYYNEVEKCTAAEAIRKYSANVLIICWSRGFPNKEDALNFKGNKVIVIGESEGCTSAGYFEELPEGWSEKCMEIPVWQGIHDYVRLLIRN